MSIQFDPRCSEGDLINNLKPLSTLLDAYDFCAQELNPKMRYDYVITCFEPVINVHGGIGSYTRLLLELHPVLEILLITATHETGLQKWTLDYPHISVAVLARHAHCHGENINNIGDVYNIFSFNIFRYLSHIQLQGVKFTVAEFPDYGAEGFFAIRGVKAGLLVNIKTLVRLHSPNFMLFYDNRMAASDVDNDRVKMHDRELACMADCDLVLFGNDAMLHHVTFIAKDIFGQDFTEKSCTKIPHPWPSFKTPPLLVGSRIKKCSEEKHLLNIAIVGRVEPRKGACLLAQQLYLIHSRLGVNLENYCFNFFGANTFTSSGDSVVKIVESILSSASVKFIFHGKVSQRDLQDYILDMDAMIYPSLFENYPNALLEVLRFPLPKLVSLNGGMPEICKDFPNVSVYDPFDCHGLLRFLEKVSTLKSDSAHKTRQEMQYFLNKSSITYERIARKYNKLLVSNTISLAASNPYLPALSNAANTSIDNKISVIIPHYNSPSDLSVCVDSVLPNLECSDEIVIVDDFSIPAVREYLYAVVSQLSASAEGLGIEIKLISSPSNNGPGSARNLGVEMAKGNFVYFIDADDVIIPGALSCQRSYLQRYATVSAVSSIMKVYGKENHFWTPTDSDAELILFENNTHCGVLMRKNVYNIIGGYSNKELIRYEDWEFFMRFTLSGFKLHVLPLVGYGYYRNPAVMTRNESNERRHALAYCQIVNHAVSFAALEANQMSQRLGFARAIEKAFVKHQEIHNRIMHPDVYPSALSELGDPEGAY